MSLPYSHFIKHLTDQLREGAWVCAAVLLSWTAPLAADVYNLKVVTDASPD
jgi:hypothetical protein